MRKAWLAAGLICAAVEAFSATLSGRAMGTSWRVVYDSPSNVNDADIRERVVERLEALERIFSTYRPQSEISAFNVAKADAWIVVSPEFADVARVSSELSEATNGAFDATIGPLVQLWGFGPSGLERGLPTAAQILAAQNRVNYRTLETQVSPPALRKTKATTELDLSSVAKGFAVDALCELLSAHGLPDHLVQIGGDTRSGGKASRRVAIDNPLYPGTKYSTKVDLTGEALSTSGNYRTRIVTPNRSSAGHIIDPRTGRPVEHGLAAVSVLHASCARSSGIATALFVLGVEDGIRWADARDIAALFLFKSGDQLTTRASSAWAQR